MASPTSNDPDVCNFDDFAADIAARRQNTGVIEMPRNEGKRRTASKRALLQALDRLGATW